MRLRTFLSIASLAVTLGLGVASSASASALPSPVAAASVHQLAGTTAEPLSAAVGPVRPLTGPPGGSCSTSFNPGAPQGAAMHQYYWNCGSSVQAVCPAHIIAGVYHIDWAGGITLAGGHWADWFWPVTEADTSYTTVFCDASAVQQGAALPPPALQPCFTVFNPGAPEGAPMTQTYVNCNTSSVQVLPAYFFQGALHVAWGANCFQNQCLNVARATGWTVEWHWPSTLVGASYMTVFSDENTVSSITGH